jgi:YVTN family beta-propeller protein
VTSVDFASVVAIDMASNTVVATIPVGMNPVGIAIPPGPAYNLCLLYDSTKAAKSGSTIPIKLQLCSSSGNDLSSSSITLHAISITQTSTSISGQVLDSGLGGHPKPASDGHLKTGQL